MKSTDVSIIVPVYNEQGNLADLQNEIEQAMEDTGKAWEVIYVDDGSVDHSFGELSEIHRRRPDRVQVVCLRRNFGQTAALAAGIDRARGELIIPIDADLQNDPADIPLLIRKLEEGYDVVSGWRRRRMDSAGRVLISRIANRLISHITGVYLHDYGCSLKVYRREIFDHFWLYGEMHRYLPAIASWSGSNITEMEVSHRPRRRGVSKYGFNRTIRVFLDLITIKFLLSYSTKPMQVFGKWGLYALAGGMVTGCMTIIRKIALPHEDITGNPWIYTTIFFILGGIQLICMGLLGEINVRIYHEGQHKPIYVVRETLGSPTDDQGEGRSL